MRFSDLSSDVCSSDLGFKNFGQMRLAVQQVGVDLPELREGAVIQRQPAVRAVDHHGFVEVVERGALPGDPGVGGALQRQLPSAEIGRASCRERVCQYV